MPCRDDGWDTPRREERHGMTIGAFEATLCGLFTVLERNFTESSLEIVLTMVDWAKVGVKRKTVEIWWKKHKAEDEERRAREEAARRKEELKASALAKLTPEEKVALGIK